MATFNRLFDTQRLLKHELDQVLYVRDGRVKSLNRAGCANGSYVELGDIWTQRWDRVNRLHNSSVQLSGALFSQQRQAMAYADTNATTTVRLLTTAHLEIAELQKKLAAAEARSVKECLLLETQAAVIRGTRENEKIYKTLLVESDRENKELKACATERPDDRLLDLMDDLAIANQTIEQMAYHDEKRVNQIRKLMLG